MSANPTGAPAVIALHQWTNGGEEVLVLRYVNRDHTSYGGFTHPSVIGESVSAPDWNTKVQCGGGIHGWPWGLSLGDGKECDWSALWQVYGVKPDDIILLSGKIKFRTGVLRFEGDWHAAMMFVLSGQMAWVHQAASGAASATGESGAASATGAASAAVATGIGGRAMAGEYGCIALSWWNEKDSRYEMRCSRTGPGEGLLEPEVWYQLNDSGEFVRCEVQA